MVLMDEYKRINPDSAEERGKRIHYIRTVLLRLSRNKFTNRHPDLLSPSALQNWEDGRHGGLTEKGAKKLIQALEKENVNCSLQWLLYGIGTPPSDLYNNSGLSFLDLPDTATTPQSVSTDEEAIAKELRFFKAVYGDTMDAIVRDDGLSPFLTVGDHVAGIRYTGKKIDQAINQLCIIQTYEGLLLTRKLEAGTKPGYYKLVCINHASQFIDLSTTDVKLFSIASIIWFRKPLKRTHAGIVTASTEYK